MGFEMVIVSVDEPGPLIIIAPLAGTPATPLAIVLKGLAQVPLPGFELPICTQIRPLGVEHMALIRACPFGVPQPVQRSYPVTAVKAVGESGFSLFPDVMS